jgi:hypothetical protein
MKTPTLKEVKLYFKNAKEVKCANSSDTGFVEFKKIKKTVNAFVQNPHEENWLVLWHNEKGYAEIISYKDEPKKDSIVESVVKQFKERSEVGIKKYGTTLDRNDLTTLEWINHAQQEAMDFCLYLEKLKQLHNEK